MSHGSLVLGTLIVFAVRLLPAQCPDGTPSPCAARAAPPSNSVAVLVFENRARDTSLALLAEGLADEITTELGRVARLDVRSAASVRVVLANGPREPRRLGQALGVRYLVDGALLSVRGAVRVSVELVEVSRGGVRWTNVYQRPTDDLFAVITSIADSAARGIVGKLAPLEGAARPARPTASVPAYQAYVKGTAALHRFDESSLRQAVVFFEEATHLDSTFAAAYAGLSEAWQWSDAWRPPQQVYPLARAAAERALALDSTNAAAWAALAGVALFFDWDFPRAERLAREALALSPGHARAHLYLAESLTLEGRPVEAVAEVRRAVLADTLDEGVASEASGLMLALRRPDDAAVLARRWRTATPRSAWPVGDLLHVLLAEGRCAHGDVPTDYTKGMLYTDGVAATCEGGAAKGHAALDSMVAAAAQSGTFLRADVVAREYAFLGDLDLAVLWFERAVEERDGGVPHTPLLRPNLLAAPRFLELWRRTGLPLPAAN